MGPIFKKPEGEVVWLTFGVTLGKRPDVDPWQAVKQAWNSSPMVQDAVNDALEMLGKEADKISSRMQSDASQAKEPR
jgi:hypothetical protein